MTERLRTWTLGLLIIFLPLSAWLVSWSGNYLVSLGRDILLGSFLLVTLIKWRRWQKPSVIVWLIILFVAATLVSYFGRQDSVNQWLRGVRYLDEPVVLLGALLICPLEDWAKKPLAMTLAASLGLVLIGGLIDHFRPAWLRFSLDAGARGFLGQIHLAGGLPRLQSTLAGPNALGLFLLVALLLTPLWQRYLAKWLTALLILFSLAALALTFSRSSYIGLIAGVVFYLVIGRDRIARAGRYLAILIVVLVIAAGAIAIIKPQYLTRASSDETRLVEYRRVWNERSQIGWWGRGAGTAGLVSEFSFDNSPNYFSENTYLDVYENIGGLGVVSYVAILVGLMISLVKRRQLASVVVAATVFGLAVAGIFIDHYTGQAALWVTLLCAGGYIGTESWPAQASAVSPGRT